MSLDVTLFMPSADAGEPREAIFVRRDGANVEVTRTEWDYMHPGVEPIMATINVGDGDRCEVFAQNITHNLGKMAEAAGLYYACWQPEAIGAKKAQQLIQTLTFGLEMLRTKPTEFQRLNPANGWGSYEGLIAFVESYLDACQRWPDADIHVCR